MKRKAVVNASEEQTQTETLQPQKKETPSPVTIAAPPENEHVEVPQEPVKLDISKNDTKAFKPSRLTIKVKLIGIISLIVGLSMLLMILIASYFFSNESEVRIQENNLNLAKVFGNLIEDKIDNNLYKAQVYAEKVLVSNTRDNVKNIFKNNPSFVYIGLQKSRNGKLEHEKTNTRYLKNQNVPQKAIEKLHKENRKNINQAWTSKFSIFNTSLETVPLLGIAAYNASLDINIILYLNIEDFYEVFRHSGLVQAILLDAKGDILLHSDTNTLLAKVSYREFPIIQKIQETIATLGQEQYVNQFDKITYLASFNKLDKKRLVVMTQIDRNIVFSPVRQIQTRNLLILLIVLILTLFAIFLFSRTITVPILSLVKATRQLEKGNYNLEIQPLSQDEIGNLTHSFGEMAVGLGEREKIKDAFGRFVNKEILELVQAGEVKLGGDTVNATVFFSDIRNFTKMSEQMSAESVVNMLNSYFTSMVGCITKTEGIIDKYIGDAIMAHWGTLKKLDNSAKSAIDAALAMRAALILFNKRNRGRLPEIKIGCGIATGPVVSGQIGTQEKLEYTVIGDTVNLASRIEATSKIFGADILISSATYESIKDYYHVQPMKEFKIRGKEQVQRIYAVLGAKEDPNSPTTMQQMRTLSNISDPNLK